MMTTAPGMRDWIFASNLPPLVWDVEEYGMSMLALWVVTNAAIDAETGLDDADYNALRFFAGAIIAGAY